MSIKQGNPFVSDYVYDNGIKLETTPRNVRFVHELRTVKNTKYKKFLIVSITGVLLAVVGLAIGIYGFLEIAKDKSDKIRLIEKNIDDKIAASFERNLDKIEEGVNSPLSPYSSAIRVNNENTPWLQTSGDVGYDDLGTGTTSDKYVVTKRVLDEKSEKYAPITALNINGNNLDWLSLNIGNQDPEIIYSSLPSPAVLTKGLVESRLNRYQTALSAAETSLSSLTSRVTNDETILSTLSNKLTNDYMLTTDINTELIKKADIANTYTKAEIDSIINNLKTQVISKTFEATRNTQRPFKDPSNSSNNGNSLYAGFATSTSVVSFGGSGSFSEYFELRTSVLEEIKDALRTTTSDSNKPQIRFHIQDRRKSNSDVATTGWFTIDALNDTVVLSNLNNRPFEVKVTLDTSQIDWTIKIESQEKDSNGGVVATNSRGSVYAFDIKYGNYDGVIAYALHKNVYSAREVDELLRQTIKHIEDIWRTKNASLVTRINDLVTKFNDLLRG